MSADHVQIGKDTIKRLKNVIFSMNGNVSEYEPVLQQVMEEKEVSVSMSITALICVLLLFLGVFVKAMYLEIKKKYEKECKSRLDVVVDINDTVNPSAI